jgi:hypothetical protein
MNNIRNRIGRLEGSDNGKPGIAERLAAALKKADDLEALKQSDPEEYKRRRHEEVRCTRLSIEATEAALRDGEHVSEMEIRLAHSLRRILDDDEAELAAL